MYSKKSSLEGNKAGVAQHPMKAKSTSKNVYLENEAHTTSPRRGNAKQPLTIRMNLTEGQMNKLTDAYVHSQKLSPLRLKILSNLGQVWLRKWIAVRSRQRGPNLLRQTVKIVMTVTLTVMYCHKKYTIATSCDIINTPTHRLALSSLLKRQAL